MLGERICDPYCMESDCAETNGLGLLPIQTELRREKTTRVVGAKTCGGHAFSAYEIHLGETTMLGSDPVPFAVLDDGTPDGLRAGRVIGTYLHGALEDPGVLAELGIVDHVRELPRHTIFWRIGSPRVGRSLKSFFSRQNGTPNLPRPRR